MPSNCIVCNKKLGLFSGKVKNYLTDDDTAKICTECAEKIAALQNAKNCGKAVEELDFDTLPEFGKELVKKFIADLPAVQFSPKAEQETEDNVMNHEVGEAVVAVTFKHDDDNVKEIFSNLCGMGEDDIEKFLDGQLSEGTEATAFCEEIMQLNNDELQAVVDEQSEYFNDAEWAYILYVNEVRRNHGEIPVEDEENTAEDIDETAADDDGVKQLMEVHADKTEEELRDILNDESYTLEARVAAKRLIAEKK